MGHPAPGTQHPAKTMQVLRLRALRSAQDTNMGEVEGMGEPEFILGKVGWFL
jgi:hypothetical protein